jgi:hypothetical protein
VRSPAAAPVPHETGVHAARTHARTHNNAARLRNTLSEGGWATVAPTRARPSALARCASPTAAWWAKRDGADGDAVAPHALSRVDT